MSACRSEQERLERMFEQAPGFMALLEVPDYKIAIANHAFIDLVGCRGLVGKSLFEAIPEFDRQGVDEILDGVMRSGEPFVGRGRYAARNILLKWYRPRPGQ